MGRVAAKQQAAARLLTPVPDIEARFGFCAVCGREVPPGTQFCRTTGGTPAPPPRTPGEPHISPSPDPHDNPRAAARAGDGAARARGRLWRRVVIPVIVGVVTVLVSVAGASPVRDVPRPAAVPASLVLPPRFTLLQERDAARGAAGGVDDVDLVYSYPAAMAAGVAETAVLLALSLQGWTTGGAPTEFSGFGFAGSMTAHGAGSLRITLQRCAGPLGSARTAAAAGTAPSCVA